MQENLKKKRNPHIFAKNVLAFIKIAEKFAYVKKK